MNNYEPPWDAPVRPWDEMKHDGPLCTLGVEYDGLIALTRFPWLLDPIERLAKDLRQYKVRLRAWIDEGNFQPVAVLHFTDGHRHLKHKMPLGLLATRMSVMQDNCDLMTLIMGLADRPVTPPEEVAREIRYNLEHATVQFFRGALFPKGG